MSCGNDSFHDPCPKKLRTVRCHVGWDDAVTRAFQVVILTIKENWSGSFSGLFHRVVGETLNSCLCFSWSQFILIASIQVKILRLGWLVMGLRIAYWQMVSRLLVVEVYFATEYLEEHLISLRTFHSNFLPKPSLNCWRTWSHHHPGYLTFVVTILKVIMASFENGS